MPPVARWTCRRPHRREGDRWIEAGATFPIPTEPRPFVAEKDVLAAIRDHLERTPEAGRTYQRYFTLTNLHNDPRVFDEDLTLAGACAGEAGQQSELEAEDRRPAGRRSATDGPRRRPARPGLGPGRPLAADRPQRAGAGRGPVRGGPRRAAPGLSVRAAAPQRPRPGDAAAGRRRRRGWLATTSPRSGPTGSSPPRRGRHSTRRSSAFRRAPANSSGGWPSTWRQTSSATASPAPGSPIAACRATTGWSSGTTRPYGAYWKSYDFKLDEGAAALARFPLGPAFAANPFGRQAFEHAGGEIIFNLPNGLQGYLLVNGRDERIAAGPIEVVGDALRTSGTATIVNGLSCMACHKDGMISGFADEIRAGRGVAGRRLAKVERLYPEKAVMDRLLAEDEGRFLAAVERATGGFLKRGGRGDESTPRLPRADRRRRPAVRRRPRHRGRGGRIGPPRPGGARGRHPGQPRAASAGPRPTPPAGGDDQAGGVGVVEFLNTPFQEASLQLELGTPYHDRSDRGGGPRPR